MLLLFPILLGVAFAQSAQEPATAAAYVGKTVGRIDFDPPDQPLPRAELDRLVVIKTGAALNLADVHTAIQNLYQTGRFANARVAALTDVSRREFCLLATLVVAVFALGLYPKPFTDVMHASVTELLAHVAKSKL